MLGHVGEVEVAVVVTRWRLRDQQEPNLVGPVLLGGRSAASANLSSGSGVIPRR
ncbi:hypothetical protein [Mycobacteroides abscessus]|uniref:hypothetical protein n=1 Tax=Mycobacteroides abscessus TaxID=36809 RepID=UPI001F2ECE40